MSKEFDPNAAAAEDSGVFGLPFDEQQAALVYLPVPWEATTSYGGGTSQGPQAIFNASHQVDLFDIDVLKPYEAGLYMREPSSAVQAWNDQAKSAAQSIIEVGGRLDGDQDLEQALEQVNELGDQLNAWVCEQTKTILESKKIPAIVGGDHSVPFGAFQALARTHGEFGILHFDAHSDTRKAYEGFTWSHASIMYNALEQIDKITKLVQVGIRDFCEEEWQYCQSQGKRVDIFFDRDLHERKFAGTTWHTIAAEIVDRLPKNVWISFDIDGLDPVLCPNTGTPVPGGLSFHEANAIVGALVKSGRRIVGFDLNEVAPAADGTSEWDANVGARLLYKLTAWTLASQGKAKLRSLPT